MQRGSKEWWRLAATIMGAPDRTCNIPALQSSTGTWITSADGKANEIATTLASKYQLAEASPNEYTAVKISTARQLQIPLPTVELSEQELRMLDSKSGTGPDALPARILKECARELALPITILTTRIICTGQWPDCWREHWIVPLHKKGVTFRASQYRGIHLTAQIPKVLERIIKRLCNPFLERTGAFGYNQFAYREKRGARDALALLVMQWILASIIAIAF